MLYAVRRTANSITGDIVTLRLDGSFRVAFQDVFEACRMPVQRVS